MNMNSGQFHTYKSRFPVRRNQATSGNTAKTYGGGIYTSGNYSFSLSKSTIENNSSGRHGAGVYIDNTDIATLTNNWITGNTAGNYYYGGGIYSSSSSLTLTNNIIENNYSKDDGGGIYVTSSVSGGSIIMRNNLIKNNQSNDEGGGCYISATNKINVILLNDNIILNNRARDYGGGVYLYGYNLSGLTMVNNIVCDNATTDSTNGYGAGMYLNVTRNYSSAQYTLSNNTICNNTAAGATGSGGGLWLKLTTESNVGNIYNNIFWGNSASKSNDLWIDNDGDNDYFYSPVNLYNNDFDRSEAGFYIKQPFSSFTIDPSNLDKINPLFVDAGNKNYHITVASPCKDTGMNDAPERPVYDLDGAMRVQDSIVDLGAYEYPGLILPFLTTSTATGMTINGATVRGRVNPNSNVSAARYYFEYGTTTGYGSVTDTTVCGTGTEYIPVSEILSGLTPGTTYHFRLVAVNSAGRVYGGDQTFITLISAPSVTTESATSISVSGATINGTVNPNSLATFYHFEYGLTTGYGSTTETKSCGSGTSDVLVNTNLTGLTPDTTYHYRLVANSSAGTTKGADQTFATLIDTDNDGMPDTWEHQYGLNPLVNDAAEDNDGDGFSNIAEYLAGTDPTDAESHPVRPKAMPFIPLLLDD